MNILKIEGIKLHAYHGCLPEEAKNGQEYIVDVVAKGDFTKAMNSDDLKDTVDYCVVYDVVKMEMSIRSKLIEHVCLRILKSLKESYPDITFSVSVIKPNPPVNGNVKQAVITLEG